MIAKEIQTKTATVAELQQLVQQLEDQKPPVLSDDPYERLQQRLRDANFEEERQANLTAAKESLQLARKQLRAIEKQRDDLLANRLPKITAAAQKYNDAALELIAAWENFREVRDQEASGVQQVIPNFLSVNAFNLPHLPFVRLSKDRLTIYSHRPAEIQRMAREQQSAEDTAA